MDSPTGTRPPPYVRDGIVYVRKSKGVTLSKQRRENAKRAAELGWHIIAEFSDTDSTAYAEPGADRAPRPDYLKMLALLDADTSTPPIGVLAWHIDRVLRDPRDAEDLIPVCRKGRHPIETARSGGYELWTATGLKRLRTDVVDAAFEVDHLIERLTSDKSDKAYDGRWGGGPVPFGWRLERLSVDDEEKVLVLDPPAADAIAWACERLLQGGAAGVPVTLESLAREWTRRSLRRRKGGMFDGAEVRRILLRPRNAGLMVRDKKIIETSRPDGKAEWPPIVSPEIWRAVETMLTEPGRGPANDRRRKWLGSSLYVCGVCGSPMRTGMGSGGTAAGRRNVVMYRCRTGGRGHVSRGAAALDTYVEAVLVSRLNRPDIKELLAQEEPADIEGLQTRLAVEEAQLVKWQRLAGDGGIEPVDFAAAVGGIRRRMAEIKREMAASVRSPLLAQLITCEEILAFYEEHRADLAWRRAFLDLFVTVRVLPARKGRQPGWRLGMQYFDFDSVAFDWKVGGLND